MIELLQAFGLVEPPALMPTPRVVVAREGNTRLYRFSGATPPRGSLPLLIVPSIINRWYVLDLRENASLIAALAQAGIDTWCIDWGVFEDEDRYLDWDTLLHRLARAARIVQRNTSAPRIGLLGYCMGATLAGIHAGLEAESIAAFVNLLGPFDFAKAGDLAHATDPRWFDADAIAGAGNVAPWQMQSGFVALRPTNTMAKWVGFADKIQDDEAKRAFAALETWASDNIPFPAAAYRTYIKELYQENLLIAGRHRARGRLVDLSRIDCPLLAVVAGRDTICPPESATALLDAARSTDKQTLSLEGGHVGAVVGSRARKTLYPALCSWLTRTLAPRA